MILPMDGKGAGGVACDCDAAPAIAVSELPEAVHACGDS